MFAFFMFLDLGWMDIIFFPKYCTLFTFHSTNLMLKTLMNTLICKDKCNCTIPVFASIESGMVHFKNRIGVGDIITKRGESGMVDYVFRGSKS